MKKFITVIMIIVITVSNFWIPAFAGMTTEKLGQSPFSLRPLASAVLEAATFEDFVLGLPDSARISFADRIIEEAEEILDMPAGIFAKNRLQLAKTDEEYRVLAEAVSYYEQQVNDDSIFLVDLKKSDFSATIYISEELGIFVDHNLWNDTVDKKDIFYLILAKVCEFIGQNSNPDANKVAQNLRSLCLEAGDNAASSGQPGAHKTAHMPKPVISAFEIIARAVARISRLSGADGTKLQALLTKVAAEGLEKEDLLAIRGALDEFYASVKRKVMTNVPQGARKLLDRHRQQGGVRAIFDKLSDFIKEYGVTFNPTQTHQVEAPFYIERFFIELALANIIRPYLSEDKEARYREMYIGSVLRTEFEDLEQAKGLRRKTINARRTQIVLWLKQNGLPEDTEEKLLSAAIDNIMAYTALEIKREPVLEQPKPLVEEIVGIYENWASTIQGKGIGRADLEQVGNAARRIFQPLIQEMYNEVLSKIGKPVRYPTGPAKDAGPDRVRDVHAETQQWLAIEQAA